MGVTLIVDGYNMLFAREGSPRDLEAAREELAELLALYRKAKAHQVTLVFDAMHAPSFGARSDRIRGIPVVYSPHGVTADAVIVEMARKLGAKAVVVSSDRAIQDRVRSSGAGFISSADFSRKLTEALYESMGKGEGADSGEPGRNRKKGPARRLTKAKRTLLKKREKL